MHAFTHEVYLVHNPRIPPDITHYLAHSFQPCFHRYLLFLTVIYDLADGALALLPVGAFAAALAFLDALAFFEDSAVGLLVVGVTGLAVVGGGVGRGVTGAGVTGAAVGELTTGAVVVVDVGARLLFLDFFIRRSWMNGSSSKWRKVRCFLSRDEVLALC